jgi:hypothetical protein
MADPDVRTTLSVNGELDDTPPTAMPLPDAGDDVGDRTSQGTRFRILRAHARGGLGEVFVAEDNELHREVALKQMQARHADNPRTRARFVLEAEITGGGAAPRRRSSFENCSGVSSPCVRPSPMPIAAVSCIAISSLTT